MKLLNIKPFQETLYRGYCGPAVLKMVLKYYGIIKSEKELARISGTTRQKGTDARQMRKTIRYFGLKVRIKDNSSFSDIKKYLDGGIPVIVDWFTRGRREYPNSEVADGHYSVVVGLDRHYIYLQDPELGKMRKLKRDDFMRVWFDFDGAYPRSHKEIYVRRIIAAW